MNKIHAKLKWVTIIDRLNKKAGREKFSIQNDSIYVLDDTHEYVATSVKEIYETEQNPVFTALKQNVFAGHKTSFKKVKAGKAKFFIANFASDKENFIEKWA